MLESHDITLSPEGGLVVKLSKRAVLTFSLTISLQTVRHLKKTEARIMTSRISNDTDETMKFFRWLGN